MALLRDARTLSSKSISSLRIAMSTFNSYDDDGRVLDHATLYDVGPSNRPFVYGAVEHRNANLATPFCHGPQPIETGQALADELGVTTRTIRRDLAALQEAGFPLYDEKDGDGQAGLGTCKGLYVHCSERA